jgi:hypothetical protein
MSIKNQIYASFVFVFFLCVLFFSISELSYAQGCCANNNNNQCSPGQSAQLPSDCNSQEHFVADSFCTGAPPMCVPTPPPGEGCCVVAPGDCVVETQAACDGGDYKGDGTVCENFPAECAGVPPSQIGCCVFPDFICTEDTMSSCDNLNGSYQGDDTQCSEFPNLCVAPPTPTPAPITVNKIPTLNELGMLVAVFLLGLAGFLFVIKRYSHKTK